MTNPRQELDRHVAAFAAKDADAEPWSSDAELVTPVGQFKGREQVLEASDVAGYDDLVTKFRAGFPDLDHTLDEVLSTDDRLAYRWTNRGTHRGEFEGIPPTGKRIEFTGTTIFRFRDGKIAEEWTSVDLLALMEQLGVIPVPEDAAV
jgi:steroid delta-isomerase-like uncharacterized protein